MSSFNMAPISIISTVAHSSFCRAFPRLHSGSAVEMKNAADVTARLWGDLLMGVRYGICLQQKAREVWLRSLERKDAGIAMLRVIPNLMASAVCEQREHKNDDSNPGPSFGSIEPHSPSPNRNSKICKHQALRMQTLKPKHAQYQKKLVKPLLGSDSQTEPRLGPNQTPRHHRSRGGCSASRSACRESSRLAVMCKWRRPCAASVEACTNTVQGSGFRAKPLLSAWDQSTSHRTSQKRNVSTSRKRSSENNAPP